MQLYIKNMVCPRCITAVEAMLNQLGLSPLYVRLGEARVAADVGEVARAELATRLRQQGFELLDDTRHRQIEQIKTLIIKRIHYQAGDRQGARQQPLSGYLSRSLHREYSQLSKLFSETEGVTIEQYAILQRIEKVKELLTYNEMSLGQIADELHYSSVAHLSAQFKKITGLTPSQFKAQGIRRPLDEL